MSASNPFLASAQKAMTAMGAGGAAPVISQHAAPITADGADLVSSTKGSGYLGIDDQPSGASVLNPKAQIGLFKKIRKQSDWARFTSFVPVSESSGQLDLWTDENFRMKSTASEGPRKGIPLHKPDVDQVTFATKTLSGAFGLRLKAIKAAARAGQDPQALIQQGVATGIGNVFMDLGVNGNTALPNDTDVNKQRRTVDGWFQKLRTGGSNYTSQADGFSYHNRLWPAMLQDIDPGYRSDKGLAWLGNDQLYTRWMTEIAGLESASANSTHHPSKINQFGANVLHQGQDVNILRKPTVVASQIASDRYSEEGYDGMAPTSIVDNGDGTLTININTLGDSGTDRSSTGADGQRYVIVGSNSTGLEEKIAVSYSAPNNTVTTSSLLGQSSASTTASDYYVKWADMTSLLLGPLRMLMMVVQNGIRIYTVFYPRDEVLEIIVHADIDYVVVDDDAFSLVDDIIAPRFDIIPS